MMVLNSVDMFQVEQIQGLSIGMVLHGVQADQLHGQVMVNVKAVVHHLLMLYVLELGELHTV